MFFAGCPRLKTAGSVVIASDSGGAGRVARWTEGGRGEPLPGSNRDTNRVQSCPLSYPEGEGEGRREREREKEYHSREDDEGKVEDDDAMDPQGTTAQITD